MRYIFIAVCALLALTGCGRPLPDYVSKYTPPPSEPPAINIAIVGDAHTVGASTGTLAWPALVAAQLLKQNINVESAISTGMTPATKDNQALTKQVQQAMQPTTRLVVLFGSARDTESSPADLSSAFTRAVSEANKSAPEARILVIGPFWRNSQPPQPLIIVRNTLKADATKAGATFIDPIADHWFVDQPELISPDLATLTDAGHAYLAGKMAPLIAQQLQPLPAGPATPPR